MGFFDIFKGSDEEKVSFWHKIENEADLQQAVDESFKKKVLIFKHSTSCFISKTVLKNFERAINNEHPDDYEFYYLDLLRYRSISNEIADRFGITHQSPQVIVLKNGKPIYNTSHSDISANSLPA